MALVQELLHPQVSTSYSCKQRGEPREATLQPLLLNPPAPPVNTPRYRSLLALALCTALEQTPQDYRRFGLTSDSSLLNQGREDHVRKWTSTQCSSRLLWDRKTSKMFQRSQSVFGFALSQEGAEGGGRKTTGGTKSKACSISRNLSLYFRGKVTL